MENQRADLRRCCGGGGISWEVVVVWRVSGGEGGGRGGGLTGGEGGEGRGTSSRACSSDSAISFH